MARARIIKPGFFKNECLAELPFEARLLFAGLWTLADREGRMEDRPKRIKAEVFPYDDGVCVDALLSQLQAKSFILRYSPSCGGRFIQIVNFKRHQTPHVKEGASEIPAPDKHSASTILTPDKSDASTPLNPSILNPIPVNRPALIEDGFSEFREAFSEYGAKASDVDWQEAHTFEWRKLDFHQRLAAVKGIRDRIDAGAVNDPAASSLPKNYLAKRMWERAIRTDRPKGRDLVGEILGTSN